MAGASGLAGFSSFLMSFVFPAVFCYLAGGYYLGAGFFCFLSALVSTGTGAGWSYFGVVFFFPMSDFNNLQILI